jgi:CubicO group peptidase (beta-lactamase class C family)
MSTLLTISVLSSLTSFARHLRGSLAAVIAVFGVCAFAPDAHAAPRLGEPEAAGFVPQRLQRLDAFMRALVDRGERAGVVTIVSRDGSIVQLGEYGQRDVANRKPMRANTIVRIYSMTEPVTAVAVMMLYEEGKLQLDDPIANYLPDLKAAKVLSRQPNGRYKSVPAKNAITIRHLLTHTSGYAYEYPAEAGFKRDAILGQGQTLEQMIPQLAKLPLVHEPGERWTYGPSANVLARLVEVISGQAFDQFLEQRIFKPLNMPDTGFRVPENKRERFAEVYTVGAQGSGLTLATRLAPQAGPYDTPGKFFAGSEGLVTTALDYWHFAHMLANGGELDGTRVLSPSTVRLMLSNHLPENLPRSSGALPGHGFGLGFAVLASPEKFGVAGTPGVARWGSLADTSFWIDPNKRIVAVLMTQYLPKNASRLERDFQALVYQALAE